jgi:nicotinamidase-related amidase
VTSQTSAAPRSQSEKRFDRRLISPMIRSACKVDPRDVRTRCLPDGYPEVAAGNATFAATAQAGDAMTQDHEATQIHDELEPLPGEPIVLKRRVSAFSGSDLDVLLRGANADSLVLAGIATSGVVLSTLRHAADLDYGLTVLADACADRDDEVHRVLTGKVFPRQAAVVSTDEWVASL